MKTKLKIISFLLSLSFIIAIGYAGLIAPKGGFYDFLIAIPKISGGGIPIKSLEEVNQRKVMLTYENIYDKSVKALRSNYNIVLKGTNSTYPYVMNYSITSGGFITREAMDSKNKLAVLNEKAAFDIFGTLDAVGNEIQIDMTPYIVTGVINDKDMNNMNIFIPATCMAESAETVMTNLSLGSELTEEYIKNELKHIGIGGMKYDFINLGLVSKVIKNNALVSLEIALLGLLLLVVKKSVKSVSVNWKEFMRQHQEYYLMELLKNETKTVQKLILLIITVIGMIITGFVVILNLFEKFLGWNSLRGAFSGINYTSFAMNVARIEGLYLLSNVLVIGFIIVFVIFMVTIWDCVE